MALHLTNCSTRESETYTLSGQNSRADPGGVGAGELTPSVRAGEMAPLLAACCSRRVNVSSAGQLALGGNEGTNPPTIQAQN